jgi:hypothetical protein
MGADFLDAWRNVGLSGNALKRLAGEISANKDEIPVIAEPAP